MGSTDSPLPPISLPEINLKRILVPVDFSDCSQRAFAHALRFAAQFQAELMLLHVVVILPPETYAPAALPEGSDIGSAKIHEQAAKHLAAWRQHALPRLSVKAVVREGLSAPHEIVLAAGETNTDLVIMGHHGRGGSNRLFIGSTAERVVRHAPCPVLVIPDRGLVASPHT